MLPNHFHMKLSNKLKRVWYIHLARFKFLEISEEYNKRAILQRVVPDSKKFILSRSICSVDSKRDCWTLKSD